MANVDKSALELQTYMQTYSAKKADKTVYLQVTSSNILTS